MAKKDFKISLDFDQLISNSSDSSNLESESNNDKNISITPEKIKETMEIQEKPFDLLHYSDNPPIQKKIPQKQKARKSKKKKPTVSKSDSQHSQKISTKSIKSVVARSTPAKLIIEIEFFDPRLPIHSLSEHLQSINQALLKSAQDLLQHFE
ncbi:MAG: hypothetical protein K9W44_10975 [Candidatus Lokiarchaeota archaeon]|nr:hypothetical protein [Candidatus Harpocratesius repetitus]